MLVTITKEWQTDETIEAPDGLTEAELKSWLRANTEEYANDLKFASWQGTYCVNFETTDDIVDWI